MLLIAPVPRSDATTIAEVSSNCSVGGERFTYTTLMSSSSFGRRLDGKEYGPLWPLVVCPNGFIEFAEKDDYSPEDLRRAAEIIREPGFAAIKGQTTYFRLGYLLERLGKPDTERWWMALQASWQVDKEPARHAIYQERFLKIVDRAIAQQTVKDEQWWMMQVYAANAERQLKQFAKARARLARLPLASLTTKQADLRDRVALLNKIIAREDSSLEPKEALPRRKRN